MKALIYKKFLDEKKNLLFSFLILLVLLVLVSENKLPLLAWFLFISTNNKKEESGYYRTLNFTKKNFILSGFLYSFFKLLSRVALLLLIGLVLKKTSTSFVPTLSLLYLFFIIELIGQLTSINLNGKMRNETKELIIYSILTFIIIFGTFLITMDIQSTEGLYMRINIYTTIIGVIASIYWIITYRGVEYSFVTNLKTKENQRKFREDKS